WLDELRPLFDGVAARYSNLWAWTAAASTFYGDLGDRDRAGDAISLLAARGLSELPVQFTWAVGMCFLAEGCRLLGDSALASEAYDLLAPHAGRCAVVPHAAMVGPIDGALASLALAMERPELACEHLERAVA